MAIKKLKKNKFHHYKNFICLNVINIDNISISDKISCRMVNYQYFAGYLDKNKIETLSTILPKMLKLNGCIFQLKMSNYQKSLTIFGMVSRIIWEKNLIVEPSITTDMGKTK